MPKQKITSIHDNVSAALLSVGMALEKLGKVHQALTPYLKIIEEYSDTPEVPAAIERVLAIAAGMRKVGQFHVAMRVYDRLEGASQVEHE